MVIHLSTCATNEFCCLGEEGRAQTGLNPRITCLQKQLSCTGLWIRPAGARKHVYPGYTDQAVALGLIRARSSSPSSAFELSVTFAG